MLIRIREPGETGSLIPSWIRRFRHDSMEIPWKIHGKSVAMISCQEKMDHEPSFWIANTGTVSNGKYENCNFDRRCLECAFALKTIVHNIFQFSIWNKQIYKFNKLQNWNILKFILKFKKDFRFIGWKLKNIAQYRFQHKSSLG